MEHQTTHAAARPGAPDRHLVHTPVIAGTNGSAAVAGPSLPCATEPPMRGVSACHR